MSEVAAVRSRSRAGREAFALWGGHAVVVGADLAGLEAAVVEVKRIVALFDRHCSSFRQDAELALVNAVRDERWGRNKKGELELLDEGVPDKRLLAVESEFASVLAVMKREGNTLSPVLRVAWDRGTLQTMTRNSPHRTHWRS